jgi:hypothetical protein
MPLKTSNHSTERVENSFKHLASAAQALSGASDDLGKVIRHLDSSLKKLGLGITVWVQVSGSSDETQYWSNELGYAKVDGKWGVALREITGFHMDKDDESTEVWAFNDAPRALKTEAVDKIPDLLEKMLQQTEETTKELKAKIEQASELAFVVSGLVPNSPKEAPQSWHRPGLEASSGLHSGKRESDGEGQGGDKPAAERFRETTENVAPGTRSLPPLPAERAV